MWNPMSFVVAQFSWILFEWLSFSKARLHIVSKTVTIKTTVAVSATAVTVTTQTHNTRTYLNTICVNAMYCVFVLLPLPLSLTLPQWSLLWQSFEHCAQSCLETVFPSFCLRNFEKLVNLRAHIQMHVKFCT